MSYEPACWAAKALSRSGWIEFLELGMLPLIIQPITPPCVDCCPGALLQTPSGRKNIVGSWPSFQLYDPKAPPDLGRIFRPESSKWRDRPHEQNCARGAQVCSLTSIEDGGRRIFACSYLEPSSLEEGGGRSREEPRLTCAVIERAPQQQRE
jgi:hypothetical protein